MLVIVAWCTLEKKERIRECWKEKVAFRPEVV